MKRKLFALLLAVALTAILMDVTYIVYEKVRSDDRERKPIEEEIIPTPDEVNMTLNVSSRGLTNYSNEFSVEGAPERSNITWSLNDFVIGHTASVIHHFQEAGIYLLRAIVSWDAYMVNLTRELRIEANDDIGTNHLVYPWYWFWDTNPWMEVITFVGPGLSEPRMWLNVSLTVGNTDLRLWIELMEVDEMEPFEVLSYDILPIGQMQYYRSYTFDHEFFEERSPHEPYLFVAKIELGRPDSAVLRGEIDHKLEY